MSRREEGVNQIARHGKWFSIVCVLGAAVISSVGISFADDQSPCRVIGDKVNPRFTALWVADADHVAVRQHVRDPLPQPLALE